MACMLTFVCKRPSKYSSHQTLTHPLFPELTKDRRSFEPHALFRLGKRLPERVTTPGLFLTLARIPQPLLRFFRKRFLRKR